MMMNDLPDRDGVERDRQVGPPSGARADADRPLVDREVPLHRDGTMAALNAWLDDGAPAPRTFDNRLTPQAELWTQISREVAARRDVRTPQHLAAQIMNALPQDSAPRLVAASAVHDIHTPLARAVPGEVRQGIVMHPAAIALVAIVCMALGAVLARMF